MQIERRGILAAIIGALFGWMPKAQGGNPDAGRHVRDFKDNYKSGNNEYKTIQTPKKLTGHVIELDCGGGSDSRATTYLCEIGMFVVQDPVSGRKAVCQFPSFTRDMTMVEVCDMFAPFIQTKDRPAERLLTITSYHGFDDHGLEGWFAPTSRTHWESAK